MKGSTSNSSIITRIITTIVLPVSLGWYGAYFYRKDVKITSDYVIAVVILIITILLVANQRYLDQKYEGILLWFRRKELVYKSIKMKLEYLDSLGKKVSFKREDHIENISIIRSKKLHPFPLETEGSISRSQTSAVNGYYSFSSNKKVFFYSDEKNITNNGFSIYSTVLKNTFLSKTEYMTFFVKNLCKFFELEVVIPKGRKIISSRLLKRDITTNTPILEPQNLSNPLNIWVEVPHARILASHSWGKSSITAYVENLDVDEQYKLEWTLD